MTLTAAYGYGGSEQKLYKIMKMQMFAILDKAKLDTANIMETCA
jgi:hypothetical protein